MTITVETWIEALESGKYKQGQDRLRYHNYFCCLGVACDLSGAGEWTANDEYRADARTHNGILPQSLVSTLDLSDDTGQFDFHSLPDALKDEIAKAVDVPSAAIDCDSLTSLNDAGVPFPLIAKVIRARPKGLFREEAP